MNRLTVLALVLVASAMLYGQGTTPVTQTVKGVLVDSLTMEAEPYATIKIVRKERPAQAVKMAVTDTNGKFEEKVAGPGNFVMTITSIGKNTVVKEFALTGSPAVVDLGTLYTNDAANELTGVEVVAQKPLVKVDIDKIEYNIEDDPDSKTNSMLEMLRKVPLVTVDGEDNIQVNGSSSFKVHVNGKPNNMMSDNPKEIFRSMPASSVKHIEVITDPGAKYDAEGVGGILNIVTIGGSGIEGYTFTFSGRAGNRGAGGSLYGTIKQKKLTVTGNYNYSHENMSKGLSNGFRKDDGGNELVNKGTSKGNGSVHYGNLEASYEIDTLRLITMSFGMYGGGFDSKGDGTMDMTNNLLPVYDYDTRFRSDNSWYSIRGNIDYQRLFKLKGRMLTFSYRINSQPQTNDQHTDYINRNIPDDWAPILNLQNQRSDGKENSLEHTFQADYVTPIGKLHTVEAGAKYIIRDNKSDTRYYNTEGAKEEIIKDRSSNFKHINNILATYAGYTLRYKNVSGKAGVRYEYTSQDVKFLDNTPGENFDVSFNDVVPNASVGLRIGQTKNLRAGYNMRIRRPSIYHLNPYLNTSNPVFHNQGNPELESEKSHAFNISYSSFSAKFNINLSLRHSFTNNGIEQITTLQEDGILFRTFENVGKTNRTGLNAYINWNASSKTRIFVNGDGGYNDYRMERDGLKLNNNGWNMFMSGGIQHTFPLNIRGSIHAYGSTPWINLQGRGNSYMGYQVSANRSFLKDRLTLSVFAGNFLKKYMTFKNTTVGKGFVESSEYKNNQQRFGVSVSYRIGELKAQVKKAARTIQNDDVKEGGSSGGGEGSAGGATTN